MEQLALGPETAERILSTLSATVAQPLEFCNVHQVARDLLYQNQGARGE